MAETEDNLPIVHCGKPRHDVDKLIAGLTFIFVTTVFTVAIL